VKPKWIPYLIIVAIVIFALTAIADRAYGQALIEDEWEDALIEHRANPPREHPIYLPPQLSRGMGNNVEQWRLLVTTYFGPDLVPTALCLISYESGGNPDAKNPTSSARGLFQLLGSLWAPYFGVTLDQLYDPGTNVRLARQVYELQGWGAWTPYQRGLCR